MTGSSSQQYSSVHDFKVKDIRGNDVDLSVYKGKVLIIINVASQWNEFSDLDYPWDTPIMQF